MNIDIHHKAYTLDQALEELLVEDCNDLNESCQSAFGNQPHPNNWFAVTEGHKGGAVAYFSQELEACKWRLFRVSELVNYDQQMALENRLATLEDYNCCVDGKEPDWSLYDGIEIAPCILQDSYIDQCEPGEEDFWTIYGHRIDGGCIDLHECKTEQQAIRTATMYSIQGGYDPFEARLKTLFIISNRGG
ncbi:MAG: hypothetical protein COA43_00530 [Robiginitomaculum sp.]|nr:MAG: hypothetical protein COA43_00530 [Robiginitomaculum sp.]